MKLNLGAALAALMLLLTSQAANAQMRITEWMYNTNLAPGEEGEWVEFTNVGGSPIDMTGYSYDDDSRYPEVFDLSGFGTVAPGESVIITEIDAAIFRAQWGLPGTVKVLGGYTNNLGRNDEINLFNGFSLVDRLTYGDQSFPGTPRTVDVSGNPMTLAALGANDVTQWEYAYVGDQWGSYLSSYGAIGNPGIGNYVVPEPSTVLLLVLGSVAVFGRRLKNVVRARQAS